MSLDALAAIHARVSPRRLTGPAPPQDAIEAMIAAATAAPDHGHLRPWRFLLIEEAEREGFGELLADSLRRREPDAPPMKLDAERRKALRSPLIVVIAAAVDETSKIPGIEQVMATSAAAQNFLIAVHALGFGGLWRTGAAAYDLKVKAALGFAPSDVIVGFFYIGTIEAAGPPREAPPADARRWKLGRASEPTGGI
jgi:nitroreductase